MHAFFLQQFFKCLFAVVTTLSKWLTNLPTLQLPIQKWLWPNSAYNTYMWHALLLAHVRPHIYIYITPARICTPLMVSRSLVNNLPCSSIDDPYWIVEKILVQTCWTTSTGPELTLSNKIWLIKLRRGRQHWGKKCLYKLSL